MGSIVETCQVQWHASGNSNVVESNDGAAGLLLDGARGVGKGASSSRSRACRRRGEGRGEDTEQQ